MKKLIWGSIYLTLAGSIWGGMFVTVRVAVTVIHRFHWSGCAT